VHGPLPAGRILGRAEAAMLHRENRPLSHPGVIGVVHVADDSTVIDADRFVVALVVGPG